MTDLPKRRGRRAMRNGNPLLRGPFLWVVLGLILVLVLSILGFNALNKKDDQNPEAAGATSSATPHEVAAKAPVLVSLDKTTAQSWTEILADPAVTMGDPSQDAGTKGFVARALYEAQNSSEAKPIFDEAFKTRALTAGDEFPVVDDPTRLDQLQSGKTPTVDGKPTTATVVSRDSWNAWKANHPDTKLVATTPGERQDDDFQTADSASLDEAVARWKDLIRPAHVLVAADVSGSMNEKVAPDGTTRMDLVKSAGQIGIQLFPGQDAMGLWIFSRQLDGDKDYKELAPILEMSAKDGDRTHREILESKVGEMKAVPDGSTGLYDTTLAAFRHMKSDRDEDSLNTIVILTDGMNYDKGSISLKELIETLKAEQDPKDPLRIVTIGISEQADAKVLKQIAEATGGTSHMAVNPEDIQEVFLKALVDSSTGSSTQTPTPAPSN